MHNCRFLWVYSRNERKKTTLLRYRTYHSEQPHSFVIAHTYRSTMLLVPVDVECVCMCMWEARIEIKIIIAFCEIMVYVWRFSTFNDWVVYACEQNRPKWNVLPLSVFFFFFLCFLLVLTHKTLWFVICVDVFWAYGNKSETTFMSGLSEC